MKILFVHQNFPGQYLHLARYLGAHGGHEVVFITQRSDAALPGVKKIVYKPPRSVTKGVHHYLRDTEAAILNAQSVARIALGLKQSGFVPDVMLAHNGWGELWYLKDVFPQTPLIGYFEFFYQRFGADVGFDPDQPLIFDDGPRVRTKNLGNLLALDAADVGQCPTEWQRSLYPQLYQPKLHVIHEGIDTQLVAPDAGARFAVPGCDLVLTPLDEVLTYVARNLEPYRGFPQFMRSLPAILAARPSLQVLVVGGDDTSYGHTLKDGQSWRQRMLQELEQSHDKGIDWQRVHFLGKIPYPSFLTILQISSVHVYLTYPFVLSWSMLEAMAAGCIVIASGTAPVQEVICDGKNGLLVDFFAHQTLATRVIEVLSDLAHFAPLRQAARQTIIEEYDLHRICLPAQLKLLKRAMR